MRTPHDREHAIIELRRAEREPMRPEKVGKKARISKFHRNFIATRCNSPNRFSLQTENSARDWKTFSNGARYARGFNCSARVAIQFPPQLHRVFLHSRRITRRARGLLTFGLINGAKCYAESDSGFIYSEMFRYFESGVSVQRGAEDGLGARPDRSAVEVTAEAPLH